MPINALRFKQYPHLLLPHPAMMTYTHVHRSHSRQAWNYEGSYCRLPPSYVTGTTFSYSSKLRHFMPTYYSQQY